jgi:hypothetical protein
MYKEENNCCVGKTLPKGEKMLSKNLTSKWQMKEKNENINSGLLIINIEFSF